MPTEPSSRNDTPDRLNELLNTVGANRDDAAFAGLFGFFAPRLKGFFIRSGAQEAMAEEMMQETMLLVWRKAHMFNPKLAGASTWIFTIARNHRIDRLRRERRFAPLDDQRLDEQEADGPKADEAVSAAQTEELLHRALRELPGEQVEVVQLSFFEHQTHSEIAQRLKLPIGTVKSRLRLAFGKLKSSLEGTLE
ncbi:MAG: sigma-70 family RNA polymerase sigma factor [Hyphomicrobiales bacterium]